MGCVKEVVGMVKGRVEIVRVKIVKRRVEMVGVKIVKGRVERSRELSK